MISSRAGFFVFPHSVPCAEPHTKFDHAKFSTAFRFATLSMKRSRVVVRSEKMQRFLFQCTATSMLQSSVCLEVCRLRSRTLTGGTVNRPEFDHKMFCPPVCCIIQKRSLSIFFQCVPTSSALVFFFSFFFARASCSATTLSQGPKGGRTRRRVAKASHQ